ncbi:MAG: methyl-accepting chemotaxis protein [Ignavibacteria bacterium]|nr:methyl-accepting chemotaxis protein [Ignavibacteria bacterium]MCU7504154.1 methyl-accepting chemotaxis protein [Ignavibacteria bacterium]MCU7516396.1 methyl-accepting chemotaxis protein [Ignavibacteria bacterium]
MINLINENLNASLQNAPALPVFCPRDGTLDLLPVRGIEGKVSRAIDLLTEDYCRFGRLLQESYLISKKVVKTIIEITGLISHEELNSELKFLSSTIGQLNLIFHRLEEESATKEKNLLGIKSNLLSIISTLESYNKIVRHLRILGISTKIENARLRTDSAGFSTIAENVEQLSEVINEKALQIKHKSKILVGDVISLIAKIKALGDEQKKESRLIVENAKHSLEQYQLSCSSSFKKAGVIHELSSRISKDINNLITFIQIQDIIRQQLEHVKENLGNASSHPESSLSKTDDLQSIKKLIIVCQLELAQVLHSKGEIASTAESIKSNNLEIRANIHEIAAQSDSFISSGEAGSGIQKVEENLSHLSESLSRNHNTNESLTSAINSLARTIADSNRFVYEIEEIGAEIELIALNARIKAAHIGSEGAGLGVLSEAIQNLSLEAKELSLMISEGLTKVQSDTENLSQNNDNDQAAILSEFKAVDGSLKKSLLGIQKSNLSLEGLKSELDFSIGEMLKKLDEIRSGLSFTDDVLSEISSLQYVLEEYAELAPKAGILISSEDREFLGDVSSSYTMNSERKVHRALVSQSQENTRLQAEEEPLGDNIELF